MRRGWLRGCLALGTVLCLAGLATGQGFGPEEAPIPRQGWAEVLTVTPKWLVLRNPRGQQIPISFDAIDLFLARWPTSPERVEPDSLIQIFGMDAGSNRVATNHVDVYTGTARSLVQPTYFHVNANGRITPPIDFLFNAEVYGDPYPGLGNPIQGGSLSGPLRTYAVGPIVSRDPLAISLGGNNVLGVAPLTPGFTMSDITPGSPSFVQPGDIVYYTANSVTPQTLVLSQLIVYKNQPR